MLHYLSDSPKRVGSDALGVMLPDDLATPSSPLSQAYKKRQIKLPLEFYYDQYATTGVPIGTFS